MNEPCLIQKTKGSGFRFFATAFLILLLPVISIAQTNVEGIEGITFTKKVESYFEPVQDTFGLHGMKVIPEEMYLSWDAHRSVFNLYGSTTIVLSSDTLFVSAGTEDNPGIEIIADELSEVNFGITDSFLLKGLSIIPDSLSFEWVKDQNLYAMYGKLSVETEGDTLKGLLGNAEQPGIEVKNGTIEKIEIGITDEFELKSLRIAPEDFTFSWNKASAAYELYGNIEVDIESDSLKAKLGEADNPGIKIKNGKIEHINIAVSDEFTLKSLRFAPKDLSFYYDRAEDDYNIHGSVEVDIEGDSIVAILGDEENPGIEIKAGVLDKINIGITEDFSLKSLEIKTDSLGFAWQKEKDGDVFHLFGKVKLDLEGRLIGFSFGTLEEPGLVFENGTIKSYQIGTSEDLHFGGLEVETEDFTIEHHENEYHVSGKMLVKELWKAIINLGEGPGSGITINTTSGHPKFDIDKASFEVDKIDLGALEINKLKLTIKDDAVSDVDAKVEFPPGWEVEADFKFVDSKLNSIDIDWETTDIEDAIELPGTGSVLVKIEGKISNFQDPHNFKFEGDMGLAFGGPFTIDGTEVSIVYLLTKASITRDELIIESDAKVGAYYDKDHENEDGSKGGWIAILGDGKLKLDLKWGNMYAISGDLNVPAGDEAILTADLNAHLSNSGAFNALVDVHLKVPNSIPLIGGQEFAEADGAVHYDKSDPTSFAAGWVKVNLVFETLKKGVKYNFKDKSFQLVGGKEIDKLSSNTKSHKKWYWDKKQIVIHSHEIPPSYMEVKVKLKQKFDWVFADVWSSLGYVNDYANCYFVDGLDKKSSESIDFTTIQAHSTKRFDDTEELTFYILPVNYKDQKSKLKTGGYWIELGSDVTNEIVESIKVHKIYDQPKILDFSPETTYGMRPESDWGLLGGVVKDLIIWWNMEAEIFYDENAEVYGYYSKDHKTVRTAVTSKYFVNHDNGLSMGYRIIDEFNPGDDLKMWVAVDDHVTALAKSDGNTFELNFPLKGQIKIANEPDSVASGIDVNIWVKCVDDQPWLAINKNEGKKTDKTGAFVFTQKVVPGTTIALTVDIPHGYELDPESTTKIDVACIVNDDWGYDFGILTLRKK